MIDSQPGRKARALYQGGEKAGFHELNASVLHSTIMPEGEATPVLVRPAGRGRVRPKKPARLVVAGLWPACLVGLLRRRNRARMRYS
jgi:hypothetical protein